MTFLDQTIQGSHAGASPTQDLAGLADLPFKGMHQLGIQTALQKASLLVDVDRAHVGSKKILPEGLAPDTELTRIGFRREFGGPQRGLDLQDRALLPIYWRRHDDEVMGDAGEIDGMEGGRS